MTDSRSCLGALLAASALAMAFFLGLCLLAFLFQRRLIYLPDGGPVAPFTDSFGDLGARDVTLETGDGHRLGATFVPAQGQGWGAVLIVNGNAGHRGHRLPLAAALSKRGLATLVFDYRGYGGNPGAPSEQGLVEDARTALLWLQRETGVDRSRIGYFGESLGTGVAVALAHDLAPGALVLRSPYTSLVDVGRVHYPMLPVALLLRDRFDSLQRMPSISAPLLVVVGELDEIVPASLSRQLFDAATAPKEWLEIPGARHNDALLLEGGRVVEGVVAFLQKSWPTG